MTTTALSAIPEDVVGEEELPQPTKAQIIDPSSSADTDFDAVMGGSHADGRINNTRTLMEKQLPPSGYFAAMTWLLGVNSFT